MSEGMTKEEILAKMIKGFPKNSEHMIIGHILEVYEMRAICELLQELKDIKACIGWFQIRADAELEKLIPGLEQGHTFPADYREHYKNHGAEEGSQDETPHDTED